MNDCSVIIYYVIHLPMLSVWKYLNAIPNYILD